MNQTQTNKKRTQKIPTNITKLTTIPFEKFTTQPSGVPNSKPVAQPKPAFDVPDPATSQAPPLGTPTHLLLPRLDPAQKQQSKRWTSTL